jgi:transposase
MYITIVPNRNSPPAILLRESSRVGGKIKTRTLQNITHWPKSRIAILKGLLKGDFDHAMPDSGDIHQGKAIGAIFALHELAKRMGIKKALGGHSKASLALLMVVARLLDQGSRLSAVRWGSEQCVQEVLGVDEFNEEDLYEALDWLADSQSRIERALFKSRNGSKTPPSLFLYDVTSSYLEGDHNELSAYGYNRDGKTGKKQIVIGLLTDGTGEPVAVRVFKGNTCDPATVAEQIRTLSMEFGVTEVTLVGDRGMLKGPQIESLPEGFRYITAISKPQVRSLLEQGVLQYDMFDTAVCEVQGDDDVRYVFRRNPVRAEEISQGRSSKLASLQTFVNTRNDYLIAHPRAKAEISQKDCAEKAERLRISGWAHIEMKDRVLCVRVDDEALKSESHLDGCYVIKTDLSKAVADAETVHARYKDLAYVERDFRAMKSECLEVRPVYVRKESRTRGHVFVVMLALLMRREMQKLLENHYIQKEIPGVNEVIRSLDRICVYKQEFGGVMVGRIPVPTEAQSEYLEALGIILPKRQFAIKD